MYQKYCRVYIDVNYARMVNQSIELIQQLDAETIESGIISPQLDPETIESGIFSPQLDPDLQWMESLVLLLQKYYTPTSIVCGLIGNTITLFIITQTCLIRASYNNYLSAHILADTFYLISLFCLWFAESGYNIYSFGAWCHFSIFLSHTTNFLSLWYHICFLLDRMIGLFCPQCERKFCTVIKSRIVIVALLMVAIPVFLNISLIVGIVRVGAQVFCVPLSTFAHSWLMLEKLDVFINGLLPYSVCVTFALLLLWATHRDGLLQCKTNTTRPFESALDRNNYVLCLAYAWIHLLFNLPLQILRWTHTMKLIMNPNYQIPMYSILLQKLLSYLAHTLPALNFVITVTFYTGFRLAMKHMYKMLRSLRFECKCTCYVNPDRMRRPCISLSGNSTPDPEGADIALTEIT